MRKSIAGLFICFAFLLSGCVTTAVYGNKFQKTDVENQYTLKTLYNGIILPPQLLSDKRVDENTRRDVEQEAIMFIQENPQYKNFKIISYERDKLWSYMTYLVEFTKN